jgi:sugar lactone lactonase YvrE
MGRTIVADSSSHFVTVYSSSAEKELVIGGSGSAAGQLEAPWDVAVDRSDNIYVVERDNHRVQIFDAEGKHQHTIGGPGTAPGDFDSPEGIHFDLPNGYLYVADTGNHRIQRFSFGSLDTSFGDGGVVGTTRTLLRDHAGFDRPTDVAVRPGTGEIYVSDFGNCRLEVLDPSGEYQRTYHGVYQPNALAFASGGDLYIAGTDGQGHNDGMEGHLGRLRADAKLIDAYYAGGIDDLEYTQHGVALLPDGSLVLSDTQNSRLVRTDAQFTEPISEPERPEGWGTILDPPGYGVAVEDKGEQVTFRWQTAEPCVTAVRLGPDYAAILPNEHRLADPTTDHEITVTGLTPNTETHFQVAFPDSFAGLERWTTPEIINTGALPGEHQFLRLKTVAVVYTDGLEGPGFERADQELIDRGKQRFYDLADYYWQNTAFKVWFDIELHVVEWDDAEHFADLTHEERLAELGYAANDDVDMVCHFFPYHEGSCGNDFGGTAKAFGRRIGYFRSNSPALYLYANGANHALNFSVFRGSTRPYEACSKFWSVRGDTHATTRTLQEMQVLRNFKPAAYTAPNWSFQKNLTAPDLDNDGVPDASPPGLTNPLSITEETLGSSALLQDSDDDGLLDLAEAFALFSHTLNLTSADTDGDGTADPEDLNPLYRTSDVIEFGTVQVDGTMGLDEPWTVLTEQWGFENEISAWAKVDNDLHQDQVTTFAAWDDDYLYLAYRGPQQRSAINLDAAVDSFVFGPSNCRLYVWPEPDTYATDVNVATPGVFAMMDDKYNVYNFDWEDTFTQPYRGVPVGDDADESDGLGFPGRLVDQSDLHFAEHVTGEGLFEWEAAIPWSTEIGFTRQDDERFAINWIVGGDELMIQDHMALTKLIKPGVAIRPTSDSATTEAGDTATFDVVLDSEPIGEVTIAISSSDTSEGTVSTTSLTFTAANWDSPQTVTVTGMDDDLNDGDANYTISVGPIASTDTDYAALAPVDVSLTNDDDDSSGITVDAPAELTTTEVGGETAFAVVLDCEPTDDVTIAVSSSDMTEGTVSPTSLTFTADDWDTPQTVTVTGVDDYMADGDVPYTVTIAAAVSNDTDYDGLDADDLSVTNEDAVTPVDLGRIDFRRMATLAPTTEGLWFQLETSHDAWLTIESTAEWTEAQLAFRLYASSNTETALATSAQSNGRPRIDHRVEEGQEFLLQVAGSAANVELRLANLVHEADGAVTVHGTDLNDVFLFDAAASRKIAINDVAYHYENTEVSTVDFHGGNGMDVVWFYDSPGNESLEAWPDRAVLTNSASDSEQDYAVEATGYESLLAYATRGGDDSATLHGSEASDKLKSYADSLRLRAKNSVYALRAKRFDTVLADGAAAGKDLAVFNGTDGDETFTYHGATNTSQMQSKDRDHRATAFGYVVARGGRGDNDVARFTDTPVTDNGGDDVFYFRNHKTQLVSSQATVVARSFDEAHATASEGGWDVARLYGTPNPEHLEVDDDTVRLFARNGEELDLMYEAIGFEAVKVYLDDEDTGRPLPPYKYNLLLYGWDD